MEYGICMVVTGPELSHSWSHHLWLPQPSPPSFPSLLHHLPPILHDAPSFISLKHQLRKSALWQFKIFNGFYYHSVSENSLSWQSSSLSHNSPPKLCTNPVAPLTPQADLLFAHLYVLLTLVPLHGRPFLPSPPALRTPHNCLLSPEALPIMVPPHTDLCHFKTLLADYLMNNSIPPCKTAIYWICLYHLHCCMFYDFFAHWNCNLDGKDFYISPMMSCRWHSTNSW